MRTTPDASNKTSSTLGRLCTGGDWAIAHGDFDGLRYVAQQLGTCAREPLHRELVELAAACKRDPERASVLWYRIKTQLSCEAES